MSKRVYAVQEIKKLVKSADSGRATAHGGTALLSTPQHDLDGAEHTNPGAYVKSTRGGEEVFLNHGTVGATETVNPVEANRHLLTLSTNLTLTLGEALSGRSASILIEFVQGGVGGFTVTLPGSCTVADGFTFAVRAGVGERTRVVFDTVDGGTSWIVTPVGAGVTLGDTVVEETSYGQAATAGVAEEASRIDHTHGTPAEPDAGSYVVMPLTTVVGGVPELVWDADNSLIPTSVPAS